MKPSEKKFGRLALVAENDGLRLSMKTYLLRFLYESLLSNWDVELNLLPAGKAIPEYLASCNPALSPEYAATRMDPEFAWTEVEASALLYKKEFARATPLYFQLLQRSFDAVVFVGLTFSTLSLLPACHHRNCAIPLLSPGFHTYLETNPALRRALLQCDYYLCHSLPELDVVSRLVPGAHARYLPLPAAEPQGVLLPTPGSRQTVLIFSIQPNSIALSLARRLDAEGHPVRLIVDSAKRRPPDIPVDTMDRFLSAMPRYFQETACAVLLSENELPPVFYNLCQWHVPVFAPRRLASMLNPGGVYPIDSPADVKIHSEATSSKCLFEGYQHASLYNDYAIRFIQEWCLDNMQRARMLG